MHYRYMKARGLCCLMLFFSFRLPYALSHSIEEEKNDDISNVTKKNEREKKGQLIFI